MNSAKRSPRTEIPREIRYQEAEIELMFRNLIRFSHPSGGLQYSEHRVVDRSKREIVGWSLITLLALISIMDFYLLWRRL